MFKQANRTKKEQQEVEASIRQIFLQYQCQEEGLNEDQVPKEMKWNKYYQKYEFLENSDKILEKVHSQYALKKLMNIGHSIIGLDVGQPWCIYWTTNTLEILKEISYHHLNNKIVKFLSYCQNSTGGFGGGHWQISHLAPTYSAILSLLLVGTEEAYELINREQLQQFFYSIRNPSYKGSFLLHENGESDLRAVYIVTIMTILLKLDPILLESCGDYIAQCQTYEGGIGAIPFAEAHGGYAYCGFAALVCMNQQYKINVMKLIEWLCNRQTSVEGGFNGRTNKVVDSCYTFWQGSIFDLLKRTSPKYLTQTGELFLVNNEALHRYVHICQMEDGGLFDKPGKFNDTYHTCYSLSGYALTCEGEKKMIEMDSVYNISKEKLERAQNYFSKKDQLKLKF